MPTETIEIEVDAETARLYRETPPADREVVSRAIRAALERPRKSAALQEWDRLTASISERFTTEEADDLLRDIEARS